MSRSSASRYARALVDVAFKESDPDKAGRDLSTIVALVTEHADLCRALTSPAVPASGKRAIVDTLSERTGAAAPVRNLLRLLATRDRLDLLAEIERVYRERLQERQQVLRAGVTSAAALDEARRTRLAERLSAVTGQRVVLDTAVDPSIIGGLVARIGSTIYDGSVKTQLAKMRERLMQ
jgi:F-type H+-transporting ATPase subunit delta